MNWNKLRDAGIRALRTFAQVALSVYLAGISVSPALHELSSWDLIQAALAAGVVALLWNLLEQLGGGVKYPRG